MAKVQCSGSCHIWSNSWISGKNPDHTAGDSVYFWFGQYPRTFRSKFVELIIEKSTIFCKESYNKASMSSDTLFCNTFSVFAVLVQAGSWQPKHTNHHDILWPYLIKILILQLWRKVFSAFWLLSNVTPIENHSRSTQIQNTEQRGVPPTAQGYTQHHKVLWTLKDFVTSKGNWEKYWEKKIAEDYETWRFHIWLHSSQISNLKRVWLK